MLSFNEAHDLESMEREYHELSSHVSELQYVLNNTAMAWSEHPIDALRVQLLYRQLGDMIAYREALHDRLYLERGIRDIENGVSNG